MLTSVRMRLFALGTLYIAPYVAMVTWCWHSYQPRSVAVLLLSAMLISLLLGACTRTWRSFFLACFPLLIVGIAFVAYTTGFGIVPGNTLGIVLVSASAEEVFGLFTVWHQKWVLLPLLAVLAAYLWLTWRLPELPIFSGKTFIVARVVLGLALPVTVYAAQSAPQLIDGLALNPVVGSVMFTGETCTGRRCTRRARLLTRKYMSWSSASRRVAVRGHCMDMSGKPLRILTSSNPSWSCCSTRSRTRILPPSRC